MKKLSLVLLLLLALTAVYAQDITPIAPKDGAAVSSGDSFTFSIQTGAIVQQCQLLIDGQVARTAPYNEQLRGRSLSYSIMTDEGTHTWSITCATDNGTISTPTQSFTFTTQESDVQVFSNGITRGSLTHQFKFKDTADQQPITVPGLIAGDYIEILMSIPPSTITSDLYVKQMTLTNGVNTIWLTDRSGNSYYLHEGNDTIVRAGSRVIFFLKEVKGGKATIIVAPLINQPKPQPTETQENQTQENTTPQTNETTPSPANETAPPATPPTQPETPTTPPVPKQGIFKRFITWLSHIFG